MPDHSFELQADFRPSGDQPQAIRKLVGGIRDGFAKQTLLGVTGSGKTYTMGQHRGGAAPADADPGSQQNSGGSALR